MNLLELKQALRAGPFAWPGGYPLYFLAADGSALSFDAVRGEIRQVIRALRHPGTDRDWKIVGVDVNWEDEYLFCVHTGQLIPCAYSDD
jgi:hypothetical protein